MSLLSKLFGKAADRSKDAELSPEVTKIFDKVTRLIESDEAQLELLDPLKREALKRAPHYDKDPKGTGPFGLCKTNPIPVNGPIGEVAYLSNVLTIAGERIMFHRIGAIGNIDIFEAVTFSGSQWSIFFLDLYHPKKSKLAPDGFKLSPKAFSFSGFHKLCADFPYDFIEMRDRDSLNVAYMPVADILQRLRARAYERPMAHKVTVELLGSALTSSTGQ